MNLSNKNQSINPSSPLFLFTLQYLYDSPGSDIPRLLTPDPESDLLCDKVTVCPETPVLEIHNPPPEFLPAPPSGLEADSRSVHLWCFIGRFMFSYLYGFQWLSQCFTSHCSPINVWCNSQWCMNVPSPLCVQWQTQSSGQQRQRRLRSVLHGGQLQPSAAQHQSILCGGRGLWAGPLWPGAGEDAGHGSRAQDSTSDGRRGHCGHVCLKTCTPKKTFVEKSVKWGWCLWKMCSVPFLQLSLWNQEMKVLSVFKKRAIRKPKMMISCGVAPCFQLLRRKVMVFTVAISLCTDADPHVTNFLVPTRSTVPCWFEYVVCFLHLVSRATVAFCDRWISSDWGLLSICVAICITNGFMSQPMFFYLFYHHISLMS